jgi:glucose/arabinose dehydrogenase
MVAKIQGSKVMSYEPFAEGWLQQAEGATVARQAWGQPVDLLELADGSLLVSDDRAGAIYRISYRR